MIPGKKGRKTENPLLGSILAAEISALEGIHRRLQTAFKMREAWQKLLPETAEY